MSFMRSNSQRILSFPFSPDRNRAGHQQDGAGDPSTTQESRPSSQQCPNLSRSSSARSARLSSSLIPALRLAGLALDHDRDRDMRSSRRESTPKPKPLLVLKLSGSSFLDSVIRDDKSKDPIYITETSNEVTSLYRLDHPRDEPTKAATFQWPIHPVRTKGRSGRSVQFGNGSWREAEDVLKSGPLGNTAVRKFNIPHYPNSLKWKLIPGNCFCCVTNAVKGPVAVLDAATLSAPPRLKIYDTLIEKETARSQDNYKGIPTILLDYLLVTSFLLVTDVQEWLDRPREARIPGSNSYTIQRWLALIHHRPAPPEPDHPTVDLSLTVPSTPPHSATVPSPGGYWETQTTFSGSNGSGSGASYLSEPFTPTTPATPATSVGSSVGHSSRPVEEAPPVPPFPVSSIDAACFIPLSEFFYLDCTGPGCDVVATGQRSRFFGPPTAASMSTSAPSSPLPGTPVAGPSTALSSRSSRRQLPTPPGPVPTHSFAQPWLYHASPPSSTPVTTPSVPTPAPSEIPPPTPVSASPSTTARATARASMRGSLRTAPIPPPPPPPQHSIPLPPKLAQEQRQGYDERRPRTAPELENMSRRRHSVGEFGLEESSTSVHPYAAAAQTYSSHGRDTLVAQMRGLSTQPGPSYVCGHMRAPSQPAPDYDTHSFVNMPPPVPPLPPIPGTPSSGGSGSGLRSPTAQGRRLLTVVNADASTMPIEDPGRVPPSERGRNTRMSTYAESVYELPPPAYDAIDFSLPPVPPLPHATQAPTLSRVSSSPSIPQVAHSQVTPLPALPVEAGGEGHRGS
ncbi:hypothetical protein C8Q80DRAFT_1272673 [Daedaleopsis nitida]|nr:hypothetical protein C8Q80DRAFT_1272673 [Daedaleopsis nitida]